MSRSRLEATVGLVDVKVTPRVVHLVAAVAGEGGAVVGGLAAATWRRSLRHCNDATQRNHPPFTQTLATHYGVKSLLRAVNKPLI